MSSRGRRVTVSLLSLRRGQWARVAACVLASLVATLCMGAYGTQTALYEFMGGGFLVPNPLGGGPSIVALVAWLAPQAAFCYFFSGVLSDGLGADASAVLPRVGSRRAWLAGKLAHLAFFSAVFTLLGELASGMALLVLGCGADASELLDVVVRCAALGFPLMLCLVLTINCLALMIDPVVAFAAVVGVYAAGVLTLAYFPRETAVTAAPWLPFVQGILGWHDCSGWTSAFSLGVPGFPVGVSLAYLGACAALAAAWALRLVRVRDIF